MTHLPPLFPIDGAQPPFFAGIELGGTTLAVGVVDDRGRLIVRETAAGGDFAETARAAEDMTALLRRAVGEAGLEFSAIARIGLAAADDGASAIGDRLTRHCDLPVTCATAADAAAWAECWVGAGCNFRNVALMTLGATVGCGIILCGRAIGGACAHTVIDCSDDARLCACGRRGHLEAYCSQSAVAARVREALAAGRASALADGRRIDAESLAAAAATGDSLAMDIILETAGYAAIGAINFMHTVDPDCVLLAGPLCFGGRESEAGRRFLAHFDHEVRRQTFATLSREIVIDFAALDDDAVCIGAAGLARAAGTMQLDD